MVEPITIVVINIIMICAMISITCVFLLIKSVIDETRQTNELRKLINSINSKQKSNDKNNDDVN